MRPQQAGIDRRAILRIVGTYALFSCLWIYLTDTLLGLLFGDPDLLVRYSELKGFAFIGVTVLLLYHLVSKHVQETQQAESALKALNQELEARIASRTVELEKKRIELESQNLELQETLRELEHETARRVRAVEDLRLRDQMMIQQSRMAAMGEMLGNIAHQWRQPLNLLGLKVQQLSLSFEQDELSRELLETNVDQVMAIVYRLSKSIDDLRRLTKPDHVKKRFSINDVVNKTIDLIRESFTEQRICISVETMGDQQIDGYPNEFAQVLLNILMNARDALVEHETRSASITVRSWTEDEKSIVTIADNAGGVQEEFLDKIFEPFFTTRQLGKGTGIGLFASRTVIETHMGGRLTVRNARGGAEFRIEV